MKKLLLALLTSVTILSGCQKEEPVQPEYKIEVQESSEEQESADEKFHDNLVNKSIKVIDGAKAIYDEVSPTLKEEGKKFLEDGKKVYNHYQAEPGTLFKEEELTKNPYEDYAPLDYLGRTGQANAVLHQSLMPIEARESISSVRPSGWHNKKVNGSWVYNRCHLIGFQLAGENANERNLITGTRKMNMEMLKYENEIADFLKRSENNYVRYRVTPIYEGENLVASSVQMDAVGYGDDSLDFSVNIKNEQDDILIDYKTGEINWFFNKLKYNRKKERRCNKDE